MKWYLKSDQYIMPKYSFYLWPFVNRKKLVLLCQIPHILGSILQTICIHIHAPEAMIAGRFISGIGSGNSKNFVFVLV